MNLICRRFGTLCLFRHHKQVGAAYLHLKMEQTECSETSAYKIQTPVNYPEESTQIIDNRIVSVTRLLTKMHGKIVL